MPVDEANDRSGGESISASEYLQDLLDRGNECLTQGDAKGAIRYYESALRSFLDTQHIVELRPIYQAIWSNKAMVHQQLREFEKMQEAAMVANSLVEAIASVSDKSGGVDS